MYEDDFLICMRFFICSALSSLGHCKEQPIRRAASWWWCVLCCRWSSWTPAGTLCVTVRLWDGSLCWRRPRVCLHWSTCRSLSVSSVTQHTRLNRPSCALVQWFPITFLEAPQHCTFCISPLSDTPNSGLGVSTNELMIWIRCVWLRWHGKHAVLGGLQERGWEPLL